MALGDFKDGRCHSDTDRTGPICELWVQVDSFAKGPPTGHNGMSPDDIQGEKRFSNTVQHSQVFVYKDCETKEILPPAFQDDAFRLSMSFYDYMNEHISRYDDWMRGTYTPVQRARNNKDMKRLFGIARAVPSLPLTPASERSIGPQDYTLKVCMREDVDNPNNWCSRYKLPDGQCCTCLPFPPAPCQPLAAREETQ